MDKGHYFGRPGTLCWHALQVPPCIYFMRDYDREAPPHPLRDSGVFNMGNGMVTPLLPETSSVVPTTRREATPAWFFPAQTM
jgi:hypothetical protein